MTSLRTIPVLCLLLLLITSCSVEENLYDMTFDISLQVKGTFAEVSVRPSQSSSRYYFDSLSLSDIESLGNSLNEAVGNYLQSIVSMYESMGYRRPAIADLIASRGPDMYTYECYAHTDYVVFAFALDGNACIASPVCSQSYTTGSVLPSDNEITVSVLSVSTKNATIGFETTNSDPYVTCVEKTSDFEGMDDNTIVSVLKSRYGDNYGSLIHHGNCSVQTNDLKPDTEYTVFSFGVAMSVPTTRVFKAEFTTLHPSMTMTLQVDSYFDGDEVVKLYPGKYDKCEGKAFVIVKADVEGDFEHYFYDAYYYYPGYEDPSSLPDSSVIQTLKLSARGAVTDTPEVFMGVDWDADVILFGVAENAVGDYSEVQRVRFSPKREMCSPIENFPYKDTSAQSINRIMGLKFFQ